MRGRRARTEHLITGLVDFLVQNRLYAVMMSSEPTAKEQKFHKDSQMATLRRRALAVLFGEHPTGAERLSFHAALAVAESLPDLVDLTDEDLREALQTTMLRILRVPS